MSDTPEEKESQEFYKALFFLVLLGMLFIKFLFEAYFEKVKPRFGHNTGVVIIIGMIVSFVAFRFTDDKSIL